MRWQSLWNLGDGKGYHRRWYVRYCYILNSFMIGGSRALYSMAESYMVPKVFAKLHPKHKTPVNALILIGILTMIAPFAGRVMMVWICDAGNFGCCLAYCMVSLSFLILRKRNRICQDLIVYRLTNL